METLVGIVLLIALIVIAIVAIDRAVDRRRLRDIESGKRPSIALRDRFSDNSIVERCPGGLWPYHRWVVSSLPLMTITPTGERLKKVSAECSKCKSRSSTEVYEKDWWLFGLEEPDPPKAPPFEW